MITYLIGNGFDISAGLNTRYSDFYKYMISKYESGECSKNDILENIKNNSDLWSNLELGLGEYTQEIADDIGKLEKFFDEKFQIDTMLMKYLRIEQERIDWENNNSIQKVRNDFSKYIYNFYNLFTPVERDEILKICSNSNNAYKVISFNYTNVIKKCIDLISNKIELLYLHGSLEKNNAILGVNDSEQIKNDFFKNSDEMLICMNKLEINNDIGEYTISKAKSILKNSNIICIYGMSIGDTDKYWWQEIINNLKEGLTEMVIIFSYIPDLNINNRVKHRRAKKDIQNQLLRYCSDDEQLVDELRSKIKVLCNSEMFKMNFILKDSDEFEKLLKENGLVLQ